MPGQAEADICITNELLLALQPQATPEAPGEQPRSSSSSSSCSCSSSSSSHHCPTAPCRRSSGSVRGSRWLSWSKLEKVGGNKCYQSPSASPVVSKHCIHGSRKQVGAARTPKSGARVGSGFPPGMAVEVPGESSAKDPAPLISHSRYFLQQMLSSGPARCECRWGCQLLPRAYAAECTCEGTQPLLSRWSHTAAVQGCGCHTRSRPAQMWPRGQPRLCSLPSTV